MEPEASPQDFVALVDPEVSRIDGLITVMARDRDVLALTTSRRRLENVRRELIGLGVPDERLEMQAIEEAAIRYPVRDDRLRDWLEEAGESGDLDAAIAVKGPSLRMTPRGIGRVVLFAAIGVWLLSIVLFSVVMAYDWWVQAR